MKVTTHSSYSLADSFVAIAENDLDKINMILLRVDFKRLFFRCADQLSARIPLQSTAFERVVQSFVRESLRIAPQRYCFHEFLRILPERKADITLVPSARRPRKVTKEETNENAESGRDEKSYRVTYSDDVEASWIKKAKKPPLYGYGVYTTTDADGFAVRGAKHLGANDSPYAPWRIL